ncbi:MAG TPA: arylamine N-acetyltransferase [Terriglobales bacterium]|nr:arylamine N-acetyltransferase [Terriglobales bacterium]
MAASIATSDYLHRIGYTGAREPTAAALRDLHRAHLFTVPFENLEISLGRKIVCDEPSFLRKIVDRRRGGFCYELNGAFAALLRELGFEVTLLSARVPRESGGSTPEFDHLALRVDLEEPWLADVGFGESFLDPLRLRAGIEQEQDGHKFRITAQDGVLQVEQSGPRGDWKRQYAFTLIPRRLEEFEAMCHYHQTSPESHFTQKRLCSKALPDGRITLSDHRLIITRNGQREERLLSSDQEWRSALQEYFDIVL